MQPDLHLPGAQSLGADQVRDWLRQRAPDAHAWWMLPPSERAPYWNAGWEPRDGSEFKVFQLDAVSGQPLPKTVGGEFFFTLHYDLHAGMVGLYIVGIAGMLMLVALVSGTIVHRRIFKDFFTLRPQAARQRAWLDAHNVLGVIGLPFHLMIAYTGLVIFIVYYMQAGLQVVYQNDGERFFHEVQGSYEREEVGRPAGPPASIDGLIVEAGKVWADHPYDEAATVDIRRRDASRILDDQRTVNFDASSGELLHAQPSYAPGYATYGWLTGLHMIQWGGQLVRWMYLLLGLSGAMMIFGGLQVWLAKREARGSRGIGLVRALNLAVCGGLPLASLALLIVTVAVNIMANFVAPAYVLTNLAPNLLNFRRAGLISATIAVLILPWHLYNSPGVILYFLGGLGALLGPLYGIIMVDYYLVRKGRVNLPELYTESRAGAYHYARGVNPRAIAAFVPAAIISTLLALLPAFAELSPFSWFFGAGLAGLIHYALAKRRTAYREVSGEAIAVDSVQH